MSSKTQELHYKSEILVRRSLDQPRELLLDGGYAPSFCGNRLFSKPPVLFEVSYFFTLYGTA